MTDQQQLPAVGSVWRKGDEERRVLELLETQPGYIGTRPEPEDVNTVRYTMKSPIGEGLLMAPIEDWLAWAEDAKEVSRG